MGASIINIFTPTPTPEETTALQRLAGAVLLQAVRDICGGSPERERVLNWVNSNSFDFWCRLNGRDPNIVRRRLLALVRDDGIVTRSLAVVRNAPSKTEISTCANCGARFSAYRPSNIFCSDKCSNQVRHRRAYEKRKHEKQAAREEKTTGSNDGLTRARVLV